MRLHFNKIGYKIYGKEQSRRVPSHRAKPGNPGYGFRLARWRDTMTDEEDRAHCETMLRSISCDEEHIQRIKSVVQEYRNRWEKVRRPSRPAGPGRPRRIDCDMDDAEKLGDGQGVADATDAASKVRKYAAIAPQCEAAAMSNAHHVKSLDAWQPMMKNYWWQRIAATVESPNKRMRSDGAVYSSYAAATPPHSLFGMQGAWGGGAGSALQHSIGAVDMLAVSSSSPSLCSRPIGLGGHRGSSSMRTAVGIHMTPAAFDCNPLSAGGISSSSLGFDTSSDDKSMLTLPPLRFMTNPYCTASTPPVPPPESVPCTSMKRNDSYSNVPSLIQDVGSPVERVGGWSGGFGGLGGEKEESEIQCGYGAKSVVGKEGGNATDMDALNVLASLVCTANV
jgi:hypothetical protein